MNSNENDFTRDRRKRQMGMREVEKKRGSRREDERGRRGKRAGDSILQL